mgnify:CR=1 FL=1
MENKEPKSEAVEIKDLFKDRDIILQYRLPRYDELSNFPVYMAQLLMILDDILAPFQVPGEEKILTQSMINNYVQKKIILPPNNKKYNKIHIIHLIVIAILKQVISIQEIAQLIRMQLDEFPRMSVAYNFFCKELENSLETTFKVPLEPPPGAEAQKKPRKNRPPTFLSEVVHSCLLAFSHRIYVKKALYITRPKNYDWRIKSPVKLIMASKNLRKKNI